MNSFQIKHYQNITNLTLSTLFLRIRRRFSGVAGCKYNNFSNQKNAPNYRICSILGLKFFERNAK